MDCDIAFFKIKETTGGTRVSYGAFTCARFGASAATAVKRAFTLGWLFNLGI